MSKKNIDEIFALPSRWVTFYKRYPMWILSEKKAFMLCRKPTITGTGRKKLPQGTTAVTPVYKKQSTLKSGGIRMIN